MFIFCLPAASRLLHELRYTYTVVKIINTILITLKHYYSLFTHRQQVVVPLHELRHVVVEVVDGLAVLDNRLGQLVELRHVALLRLVPAHSLGERDASGASTHT